MNDRLDILQPRAERNAAVRGAALDSSTDPVLQDIAASAAASLGTPMSAVSLLLEQLQIIRGHGLGGLRAIDRDVSICQNVVQERAVVCIPDAARDERVPGIAMRDFNVPSYLGAPVRIGEEVVGSICVFDSIPRQFDDRQRAELEQHAARASARLQELAAEQRGSKDAGRLMRAATRPAFQDLRNSLWQLGTALDQICVASQEASTLSLPADARPAASPETA